MPEIWVRINSTNKKCRLVKDPQDPTKVIHLISDIRQCFLVTVAQLPGVLHLLDKRPFSCSCAPIYNTTVRQLVTNRPVQLQYTILPVGIPTTTTEY